MPRNPAERYQSCQELVEDLGKHPLVAKGGPITVQTKMSPAAATMIGAKTPVSGQRPLPSTTPTPRPLPVVQAAGAPTTPSQAQPVLSAHEPVLQRQATSKQKSAALPLAIAAILLLGIGGGAYAFRDRIPMLKQFLEPSAVTTGTTVPPSTFGASNTVASTTTTTSTATAPANTVATTTQTAAAVAPAEATNAANAAANPSTTSNTTATTSVAAVQEPPANTTAPGPAARASQVEPLKELAAAQAAEATPAQQVARVTEPPPVAAPPKPHIPTIAVLAVGDESIAEPAERAIEQALSRHGYHLIDQDMMPRVAQHLAGNRPNMAALLETLARNGRIDAVVIVHARPVGSEQIQYYGQSSALNTAQLNVNVFAVEGQRKLGAGWSEQVHFTSLNAADQAHDAVEPMLEQLEEKLVAYRARGNRG